MPKVGKTSAKKRRRMNKKYRMEKRLRAMLEQQLKSESNGGEKPSTDDNVLECNENPAVCHQTEESQCEPTATEPVVATTTNDTGTVKDTKEEKEISMEHHIDNNNHEETQGSSHNVVSHSQPSQKGVESLARQDYSQPPSKTSHHDEETVKETVAKDKQSHESESRKRHVEELHRMIYEGEQVEEVLKIVKILTGQLDKMKQIENREKGQVGRRHQSQHQRWQLKLIHKFIDKLREENGRSQVGKKRESYSGIQNGSHPIESDGSVGQAKGRYHVPR